MSTARVRQMAKALRGLGGAGWKPRLLKQLATEALSCTLECFERSRGPYGHAWRALDGDFRSGQPLRNNGHLMASLHPELKSNGFSIATNHPGAKLQNYGGTVKAKPGGYLVFTKADGSKVFAKKVVVPPRPFFPKAGKVSPSWKKRLDGVAKRFMEREVSRAG